MQPPKYEMSLTGSSIKTGEESALMSRADTKFYEKLILCTYLCDFGNVLTNSTKKK